MVTFIFKVDLRRGQGQIKFGQIGTNSETPNFATKNMPIVSSFVPGLHKCHLCLRTQLEMPKNDETYRH